MTTTKQGGKKAGATKKGGALSVIQGGKSTDVVKSTGPMLKNGKTVANVDALRKALGVYGVAFKPDASPADLLALVRKALDKKLKGMKDEDKVKCTAVCGEVSTADTDFCPYCGDEGVEGDEPGAELAVTGATNAGPAVANVSTKAGIAVATKSLDESVAKINALRNNLAANSYDLGIEIRKIHEEELWKARGHESFKDFIEKELEIGRTMAYRLIDITREFDRATFEQVGSRKLSLIATIQDAEAREEALGAAKAGATTKEVVRARDAAKGKAGKDAAPPREPRATMTPPKKSGEITLLAKVGSKPQTIGWRSASSGRPIQSHKDDAYAEFQLSEDVRQRIALKCDKDGNILGLTIAFARVE